MADLLIEQPTKFQLVIDGADSPSHRVDDPPIGSHRATSETAACGVVLPSERQKSTCAVTRRRFPVGASPTGDSLQPEATGAGMEATKCLKPPDSGHEFGDRASVHPLDWPSVRGIGRALDQEDRAAGRHLERLGGNWVGRGPLPTGRDPTRQCDL